VIRRKVNMRPVTAVEALASLQAEAERRYGSDASSLQEPLKRLAQDMQTISAVVIPDWMLGELG
jgi:hypothetical protein